MESNGLLIDTPRKKQQGRRPTGIPQGHWEPKIGAWILECGRCGIEKTSGEFQKSRHTTNGLQLYCIECMNEIRRTKRQQVYQVRDMLRAFAGKKDRRRRKNVVADVVDDGGESGAGV